MENTKKMAGIAGTMLLVAGMGAGAAATAVQQAQAAPAVSAAAAHEGQTATAQGDAAAVAGTFSYGQNVVTGNATVKAVFSKAAAAMCVAMPQYTQKCVDVTAMQVAGPAGSMAAAVGDLVSGDEQSSLMACACSTNGVGGGAIANADVSGITMHTLAIMMKAL